MQKKNLNLKIWTPRVSNAWQLPNELTVSQWADKYRILSPLIASEPGQWRTDRTPYLREIMDAFSNPLVEKITLMTSTQVGKTEAIHNMIAYTIDQDPGATLLVMPREADAKGVSKDRVRPMITDSPKLSAHLTADSDDVTKLEIKIDRMILYFAGANSPAGLSSKPVKKVFFDETDKYPKFSGDEADPIKLGTERTHTYWDRKVVQASTPTVKEGYIYREYERSDKRSYYVPCPYCAGYQIFTKDQIKVPDGERDTEKIKQQRLAWYECIYCRNKIRDPAKKEMLLRGRWMPVAIEPDDKGKFPKDLQIPEASHVGFHLNAIYSPWITFSEIIAEWFACQGRAELMMNFINSWLAQIWQETTEKTEPERLKRRCQDYKRGTVPEGSIVLAGGVDVQKNYFVITIRAFGVYPRSWLVLEEITDTWDQVKKILFEDYYPSCVPGIEPFPVSLSCLDTGYRASEVYDVCREYRSLARAIKGKDALTGVPFKVTTLDRYPSGKPIPEGLLLYLLDTTYFKDKISRMVHAEESINKWYLHSNPSPDYLKWFCSEHKALQRDRKRGQAYEVWQPVSSHAKTHYWDAEVYAMAAAEMLRVYALREEDIPQPQLEMVTAGSVEEKEKRGWLPKRKNWLRHG